MSNQSPLNRLWKASLAGSLAGLGAIATFTGCLDPQKKFDAFEERVVDAAPIVIIDGSIIDVPDITGSYLFGFDPSIAMGQTVLFMWDLAFTANGDGTGSVVVTATAVDHTTKERIGTAVTLAAVPVNMAGEFTIIFDDFVLPGAANPVTGSELIIDGQFAATVKSKDLFCGIMPDGAIVNIGNTSLDGSTFAAQRVPDGASGDDLPPPIWECPVDAPIDAGVPDAGPADAGVADAAVEVDATVPDATI